MDWTTSIFSVIFVGIFLMKIPRLFFKPSPSIKGKTLIVIAHPDDESMFFGPTVMRLKSQVKNLLIVSLSRGDFYGNGDVRTLELAAAAQVFGVDDVCIVADPRLLDGSHWDGNVILELIEPIILNEKVKNVITFDDYGISGHSNHQSLHRALKLLPSNINVFYLESVSIFRKYLAVIDVLITILLYRMSPGQTLIQLASVAETTTIMTALSKHSSQMVWFRKLYMMFSRYMIVNTLSPRNSKINALFRSVMFCPREVFCFQGNRIINIQNFVSHQPFVMADAVIALISDHCAGEKKISLNDDQRQQIERYVSDSKATALIVKKDQRSPNGLRISIPSGLPKQSINGEGAVIFVKVASDGASSKTVHESQAINELRELISQSVGSSCGILNVLSMMRKYSKLESVMGTMKNDRIDLMTRVLDWAEDSIALEHRDDRDLADVICILKGKERKIDAVAKVCESLFSDLPGYKETKRTLDQLSKEVSNEAQKLFRDWIEASKLVNLNRNQQCIEIDTVTQDPVVTFDYKLVMLSKECKMLRAFGYTIPDHVAEKELEVVRYGTIARDLREIVNFYCSVGDQILHSQKPLLIDSAKKFTSLLESRDRISWNRDPNQLQVWVEQLRSFSKTFSSQNRFLRNKHQIILHLILLLFDKPPSKWRQTLNEVRSNFHEVDERFSNTYSWKLHWDHQLYKLLEYHFNDALLKSDTWLGSGASNFVASSNSDIFRVDLCFVAGSIVFRPSIEEIKTKIFSRIRKFLSVPSGFRGLIDYNERESIFTAIYTRSFLSIPLLYLRAGDMINELKTIAKRFKEWTALHYIISQYSNSAASLSTFLQLDTVDDYKSNLILLKEKSQQFHKKFIENEIQCKAANIIVNLAPIKSSVEWFISEMDKLLVKTLKDRSEFDARELKREMTEIEEKANHQPQNTAEYKELEQLLRKELSPIMNTFNSRYKDMNARASFLKKWSAKVAFNVTDVSSLFEELQMILESRESLLDSLKGILKSQTESNVAILSETIARIERRWNDTNPTMRGSKEFIDEFKIEVESLVPEFETLKDSCEYFELSIPKTFSKFDTLVQHIRELDAKLNVINEFVAGIANFLEMEWIVSRNKLASIEHYVNKWEEDHPKSGAIIEQRIKEWTELFPILKLCRGECFARSHWQEFISMLGLDVSHENLTLSQLISKRDVLKSNREFLKEINAKAIGETSVRETFNELDDFAASAKFTLFDHVMSNGTRIKLIKDWRNILNRISESTLTLQSLKGSEYFSNEFAERSAQWESRLTTLDTIIDLLNALQRKWMYLEPIHAKNDRGSAFSDHSFTSASRDFVDVMRGIESDNHVIRLLRTPNLAVKLKELDTVMISCQKKLSVFMEKSRGRFPRFYFLADDDLLLVLAGKSDVSEGGLLKKLFNNNLVKLHFSEKVIISLESPQGEVVTLLGPVSTDTDQVETWLRNLETAIKNTLKKTLIKLMQEGGGGDKLLKQPLDTWTHIPSQIFSLCQWIHFTSQAEKSIRTGSMNDLKRFWEQQLTFLTSLRIDDGEIVAKIKIKSLVLDTIHFLAVIDDLILSQPRNDQDWKWQRHLRYYYRSPSRGAGQGEATLVVSMGLASSEYSFEYLGCHGSGKLVHTPLTDKCYLTCMQALSMGLGGNPYGPAGTGKTETVKALGQQLGRQVLVFNCDEAIDVKAMTRILVGLIKCGAWGCFDEFNRLSTDVLSALSSQIHSIQTALKNNLSKVELPEFGEVDIDKNTAIFITLNPMGKQYKGRNRLPDNLKALFLPVAMTVPDCVIIARVLLLAEGFDIDSSKIIGEKITSWFDLAKNTMSRQNHYDWGLRAIKSCLNSSGRNLKSIDNQRRDQLTVVVDSLKHQIKSKLIEEDDPRFDQLIKDVFRAPIHNHSDDHPSSSTSMMEIIYKVMERNSLIPDEVQASKILELDQQLQSRLGVVIFGESGVGKSTIWKTLIDVKKELKQGIIEPVVINPKSMHRNTLLGHIDEDTREWQDGVLPFKAREISRADSSSFFWLIFDGDIDPEWVEALNSVLDDNQVLTLPSGERIDFDSKKVNLLFEVTSLKYASPATISRLGVISVAGIKNEHVIQANLNELNFPTSAEELTSSIKWPQPKLMLSDAKTLLSQIRFSLTNRKDVHSALKQFQGGSSNSTSQGEKIFRTGHLVVTPSISKSIEFMTPWIDSLEAVLIVGGRGVGKHTILNEVFFTSSALTFPIFCCPQTTPADLIQTIRKNCSSISSGSNSRIWRASNASKCILYLRNLELLVSDKWNSNPVIAFLVNLLSYHGFYDESMFEWNEVQNIQIIATCTNIDCLDPRFLNRVHVCEVVLPPISEIQDIISLLCPQTVSWNSSFSSHFASVLKDGNLVQDLDVMRCGVQIISLLTRYESVNDRIIRHETRKVLSQSHLVSVKADNINGDEYEKENNIILLTHCISFANKIVQSDQNEMRQLIMKYCERWINELEVFIPKIGLTMETLQVFAESSIFLSDPTPGLESLLFLGNSASGRKLSLKVYAHAFNYDIIWSPKSKLSEKHLLNELKHFIDTSSNDTAEDEEETLKENEGKKVLILLDQVHFQQIQSLLKHIYTFIRENKQSSFVIKVAIMMSTIPEDQLLIWPRICHVRMAPALSQNSLIQLPTLLSEEIQPDFSPNFSHLLTLFPEYLSDNRRYLSFIYTYVNLMKKKTSEIGERRNHLKVGVEKLREASQEVEKLKEGAAEQRVILAKKRQEADEALAMITTSMEDSEDQKVELEEIRKRTEKETAKLQVRKAQIDEELKEIEPTLMAAKRAVGGIKSDSLSEIRSLRAPPEVIRDILEGVLRLMGVNDTSWISMKSFLARRGVKDEIMNFDARKITPEMREKVQQLLSTRSASFEEKNAKRASAAAAPLAAWVMANVSFSQVLHKIKPLEDEQNKLESGLKSAVTRMKSLSNQLEGVETNVGNLKQRLNQVTIEAAEIEVNLKQTSQTLSQSEALVSELSGEFNRWQQQLKDLDHEIHHLPTRCIISSAFLSFMGKQKSPERRKDLIKDCCQLLQVPLFDVTDFLAFKSEAEVFIKIETPFLTPLIVDPARKVVSMLTNNQRDNKVERSDLRNRDWLRVLELSLRFGKTFLIEDFNRIEMPLVPVLKQQTFGSDGTRFWTFIGEKRVDLSTKFKLFLMTNDEVEAKGVLDDPLFNVINMAPSGSSTSTALLSLIIKVRRPELEEKKLKLQLDQECLTDRLKELEMQLLAKLNSSSTNLLNDHQLIQSLKQMKSSSKQVAQSLKELAQISNDLDKERAQYEELANFASCIFFTLQELSRLNNCYIFGMRQFEKLFVSSLEAHTDIDKLKLVKIVFSFVMMSLFPDDKIIFRKFFEKNFARQLPSLSQSPLIIENQSLRDFLKNLWYSSKNNYVLILTSPGCDPIAEIKLAVSELKMDRGMDFVSMGADVSIKEIEQKLQKTSQLCISNLHLVIESLPRLAKLFQDLKEEESESGKQVHSILLVTECHDSIPNNLLEMCTKYAYQSPPGLMPQVKRLTDTNSPFEVKRLAFLHSVCCERRHFVPLGWTKFYEFGFVDFRSSLYILQEIKEKKERNLQVEFVRGILGQVIYGGKMDSFVDESILKLLIKRWFHSLDTDLNDVRNQPEVSLLDLPLNVTKWYQSLIGERVAKGLIILEKTGMTTAIVRQEFNKLKDLWNQLDPLSRNSIQSNVTSNYQHSSDPVIEMIKSEIIVGHRLLRTIEGDFKKPSPDIFACLASNETPESWLNVFESGPEKADHFVRTLDTMMRELENYLSGSLDRFNLSHFLRPASLLNCLRQKASRELNVAIDETRMASTWNKSFADREIHYFTIYGLILEGAVFEGSILVDCNLDSPLRNPLPPLLLYFATTKADQEGEAFSRKEDVVNLPLFGSSSRETIITFLNVPCRPSTQDHWITCAASIVIR